MYKGGIESNFANADGAADAAKLPDLHLHQAHTPESAASNSEIQQTSDMKFTVVHIKQPNGGKPKALLVWDRGEKKGRHRLEEGELTFDEVMAQYDEEINRLKLELEEIIQQKKQAIADISPKSEPDELDPWVVNKWDEIQARQEQDKGDKESAIDQDDTDRIPIVSQQPEDDKGPAVDEDKDEDKTGEIRVVGKLPGDDDSVFTTTLPAPDNRQRVPQTNLGEASPPPGPGDQPTDIVDTPKAPPVRSNVDSSSKVEHKQVKKLTWQERVGQNKNKIAAAIGGVALGATLITLAAIVTSSLHHNNDTPEDRIHLPPASTETVPDFAADGIVTQAEMQNHWVSQVYAGESMPYGEMLENAGSAISSGDARVVYQWDGTYFYKVTPKAMHSFGLRGDPTSTQNVMKVLAAHSDGEIKIAS